MVTTYLRATILSKFPEKVIHEYHLTRLDPNKNDMSTIREGLQRIILAMESSVSDLTTTTHTTEALHMRTERPAIRGGRRNFGVKPHPTYSKREKGQENRKRKGDYHRDAPINKKPRRPCLFCNMNNHHSADCRKFDTIEARKKKLVGRCFKCLRNNHQAEQCKRDVTCFRCGGGHLQLLCTKAKGERPQYTSNPLVDSKCYVTNINNVTYLQTAVIQAKNPNKDYKRTCRLILDSGSQRSYITAKKSSILQLVPDSQDNLLVYTFGAVNPKEMSSPSADITIITKRGITKDIRVNIVPHITDSLPIAQVNNPHIDLPADDDSVGETIDLLIGNDYCTSFMRNSRIKLANDLYALDSDFGYVLSGRVVEEEHTTPNNTLAVNTYCQCHVTSCPYFTEPDLPLRNIDVKFLWSLENIGITDSPKVTREEEAVRHFNDTVKYHNDRYQVKWPWIHYPPDLPTNFGLALGRLKSILKRNNMVTTREYDSILKEQLELGIIEIVNQGADRTDHPIHYLPHHMVKQQGKPGRIVYDASAKTSGHKSLNECLYSGPSMLEDLTALLIKFRTKKIALLADVEKAFLQVALQEEDRDVTRFLWVKDIGKALNDENLLCLRFCRVPFGIISSPFLLTATIRYHLSHSNETLLKTIAERCYVDNLVTGANSTEEATQIFDQTRSAFGQLSMNIRDWISNDEQFMELTPKTLRANQGDNVKVLGLNWNVKEDKLKLKVTQSHFNMDTPVDTKRRVLRALARIYDPCGFVCPLILSMKLIFQNLCEMKVKWDTKLPTDLTQSISKTLEKLNIITNIEIPRYIGSDTADTPVRYHLHCFTDASKNAYAAVVYLKAINEEESTVSFVMAKSRISQTNDKEELKIPKLELLGFLIGSRLLKYLRQNLDLSVEKEFLWTDSLVVLSWMKSNKLLPRSSLIE
ncbi:uncharacterized protein [Choristoneura fumiferana]|uniref:uncharacterized protein n=1 Tax=Choristoneura fumiferana TaxID=7141 RepID=UPI003D1577E1